MVLSHEIEPRLTDSKSAVLPLDELRRFERLATLSFPTNTLYSFYNAIWFTIIGFEPIISHPVSVALPLRLISYI